MLGMELCGTSAHQTIGDQASRAFFRQPRRTPDDTLETRWNGPKITPATTATELDDYLANLTRIKGVGPARKALRYLMDGSASPGESILAIMTTLPCHLGGYGFKDVRLNPAIPVDGARRRLTRADAYHPDCYLKQLDIDLEYESNLHHSKPSDIAHDKARRNDIQALGIEVWDVTWDMLSHIDSLDLLFDQILERERARGFDKRGSHARRVHHPDNRAVRAVRLQQLLPS